MSVEKKDLITIRDRVPGDNNFIFATWLNGLRYGNDWFNAIQKDIYFSAYHKIIENILAKPSVTVKIACLKDDPEVILGYAVLQDEILHYIFCKSAWRRIGLAKDLVPKKVHTVTHLTKIGLSILKSHPNLGFNPFIS